MVKEQIEDSTIFNLAEVLDALRSEKKRLEDELKDINAKKEEVEKQLSELMVQEEIPNFTKNGQTFYLNTKLYASCPAENKPALIAYLKENDFASIVKEEVSSQTLNSFVKELSEEGEVPEELQELLNIFEKTTVGVRKATKK